MKYILNILVFMLVSFTPVERRIPTNTIALSINLDKALIKPKKSKIVYARIPSKPKQLPIKQEYSEPQGFMLYDLTDWEMLQSTLFSDCRQGVDVYLDYIGTGMNKSLLNKLIKLDLSNDISFIYSLNLDDDTTLLLVNKIK